MVNATPAWARRMPASRPDIPAPMITTWNPSGAVSPMARWRSSSRSSVPVRPSSSSSSGRYSSGTSVAIRKSIISFTSAGLGGGAGTQPPSRYARIASSARARTVAWSAGSMNPWTSFR